MINLFQIALRFLKGRHSSGLISLSFFLSILGLAIGTASLLLISGFTSGFKKEVKSKLSTIDGEIRIQKYDLHSSKMINNDEFNEIKNNIADIKGIKELHLYSQTQAMLQSGQQTDGTLLFGVDKKLFNLLTSHSIIDLDKINFEENVIVLGSQLANNLGLKIGDYINLFDLDLLTNNQQIKGIDLLLIGTIKTGFSEYDKLISFIPKIFYDKFFLIKDKSSGIILESYNNNIYDIVRDLRNKINFPLIINTLEDRHSILLKWMNIYHIPIQLVMGFITLLAIFNISSTLWMISIDKNGSIGVLKAIGYSTNQVKNIFILKGVIIGTTGVIMGVFITFIIYILQTNYHLISLSSEVYFLDYLPINLELNKIILILISIFSTTILLTFIPANNVKGINPTIALKQD